MSHTTDHFRDALAAAGLTPAKELNLQCDGKIHRYRAAGDKPGSYNAWYVLHSYPLLAGAFGSWKTGESHTWCEKRAGNPPTAAERAELQRQMKAAQAARTAELGNVQASARERAATLWATAHPATNAHPYLKRKQIGAYGIRQLRDMLVIAARDVNGQLHTLQFISPDGSKRFLTGGRITGCYFAIGRPVESLLLCEGLATASTLYQATGRAVAVAFNCGNLMAVAKALRMKFPALHLIVCADNDLQTPGNPGLTHARAAARAVGGYLAVPKFPEVRP
jgi:putative DNA primase/helicase